MITVQLPLHEDSGKGEIVAAPTMVVLWSDEDRVYAIIGPGGPCQKRIDMPLEEAKACLDCALLYTED